MEKVKATLVCSKNLHFNFLVDAICFALGMDIKHLRVNRLEDLLTTRGSEVEPCCCVQLVFSSEDDDTLENKASLTELKVHVFKEKGIRKFKLNNRVVSMRMAQAFLYQNGLRHFSNFVILQNNVTTLMFKSPKELAEMITDVNGGLNFQQQVEKAHKELEGWRTTEQNVDEKIKRLEVVIKADLDKLKKVNQSKKNEQDAKETEVALLVLRRRTLEEEMKMLSEQRCLLEIGLTQCTNEIEIIQSRITSSSDVENRKVSINNAKNEINSMEKDYQESQLRCEIAKEELSVMEEQLAVLNKHEEVSKTRLNENHKKLSLLKEELSRTKIKISTIRDMILV